MTARAEVAAALDRINALYLADPCPPSCWHHVIQRGGSAMRWTPDYPALRFRPAGLRKGKEVTR